MPLRSKTTAPNLACYRERDWSPWEKYSTSFELPASSFEENLRNISNLRTDFEQRFFSTPLRNNLESHGQLFPVALHGAPRHRYRRYTCKVHRHCKNIFEVQRHGVVIFLPEFKRGRRRRRHNNCINKFECFRKIRADEFAYRASLAVICIGIARGEHERADEDAAACLRTESCRTRLRVDFADNIGGNREAVANAVEAREIGRNFCGIDDVIHRERVLQRRECNVDDGISFVCQHLQRAFKLRPYFGNEVRKKLPRHSYYFAFRFCGSGAIRE